MGRDDREGESAFITSLNADLKKAKLKKQRREELLQKTEGGQQILKLHSDLQALAEDLDARVENRLAANETAFFQAYKSHMFVVQQEFAELRQRADEEETKTRREARIQSLEKELDWFMSEALRLDELCKKHKKELDKWRGRSDALEEDRQFLENQIMSAKKGNKALRNAVETAQTSAYAALVEGELDAPVAVAAGHAQGPARELLALENTQQQAASSGGGQPFSPELEARYQACVKRLKQQLDTERKLAAKMRGMTDRQFPEPNPLEQVFLDAVEGVRNSIRERKAHSFELDQRLRKGERAIEKARLKAQAAAAEAGGQVAVTVPPPPNVSLDDFTVADRRQVVEILLSSEHVLQFLYDKLFPPAVDSTGTNLCLQSH